MLVTLDELKTHLRIEHEDEDAYLDGLLRMAQASAEDFCLKPVPAPAPDPVRWAILLYAGHFYAQRENADRTAYEAMLAAFHALLWPYRSVEFMF